MNASPASAVIVGFYGHGTKRPSPCTEQQAFLIMLDTVFPGQDLNKLVEEKLNKNVLEGSKTIKLQIGPGIIQSGSDIVSLRPGRLHYLKQNTKLILESPQKRYVPLQNDLVIGIITARLSEFFRVDIGSQNTAVLSLLTGFEGATKKNRPTWDIGTVIFARVSIAHPELDTELTCFDPSGKVPVELFGQLADSENTLMKSEASKANKCSKTSLLLRTSCNYSRKLQNPSKESPLAIIGKYFAFEIASGANGRIFIESENVRELAAISQIISKIDVENSWEHEEIESKVKELSLFTGKFKKTETDNK